MISFTKETLREAISGLRVLKLGKHHLPVLHCVRVTGCDTLLHLERTDLDQVLRYEGVARSDAWTQLLVPYDLLATAAKQADNGSEIVVTGGERPTLTYPVHGLPVSLPFADFNLADYPPIPKAEGDPIALPAGVVTAMKEALGCASTDEPRYVLNSVFLDAHAVVATNGRQLYRRNSLDLPIPESGVIFPSSPVINQLPESEATLWIWSTPNENRFAQIDVGSWRWITKLVSANYPDYPRVIPKLEQYPVLVRLGEVDATRIKSVLPKLPGFKDRHSPIVLRVDPDGASLSTAPGFPKVHVALEHSEVVCEHAVQVGFNANYLIGALETSSRELRVRDEVSPVLLTGDSRMQLWMPVRLNEVAPVKPVASPDTPAAAPGAAAPSPTSDPSSESPATVVPVSETQPVSETHLTTQPQNPSTTMVAPAHTTTASQPVRETREDAAPGAVASRIPPVAPAQPTTVMDAFNARLNRLRDLLRETNTEFANIQALVKEQQRSYRVLERDHEALKKNIRALREVPV
jgi:DNA polymerase-3 subunit beta